MWQLRRTLPRNLKILAGTGHELIILDCGSTDGTVEFVRRHSGFLYVERPLIPYHIPRAKNIAHSMSTGGYVFNLDADNFITRELLAFIEQHPDTTVHDWSGAYRDGSYGRIGATIDLFRAIGGYDERLLGAGTHDGLFLQRSVLLGSPILNPRTVGAAMPILNTKADTITHLGYARSFEEMVADNRAIVANLPVFLPNARVDLSAGIVGGESGAAFRIPAYPYRKSVTLRYWFMFDGDFEFAAGGKLPGLGAGGCPTGGRPAGGWSARVMWRHDNLELYVYPGRSQNGRFGISIPFGRKAPPGAWHEIRLEYSAGRVAATFEGVTVGCPVDDVPCSTVLFHVFRGGSSADYAADRGSSVWISNSEPDTATQFPCVTSWKH